MKFPCYVPIGRATLHWLRQQGYDTISVYDRLPPNASDPEIIRLAAEAGRIIICFDLDFGALVALSRQSLPSVMTLRTSRHGAQFVNQRLAAALPSLAEFAESGFLAVVEDHRVRVRRLPIDREKG